MRGGLFQIRDGIASPGGGGVPKSGGAQSKSRDRCQQQRGEDLLGLPPPPPPVCNPDDEQTCYNNGGNWDPSTCGCTIIDRCQLGNCAEYDYVNCVCLRA